MVPGYCWPHFAPWSISPAEIVMPAPLLPPSFLPSFLLSFHPPMSYPRPASRRSPSDFSPRFGSAAGSGASPCTAVQKKKKRKKQSMNVKDRLCVIGVTQARTHVRAPWSKPVTVRSAWWIASARSRRVPELTFCLWNYYFFFLFFFFFFNYFLLFFTPTPSRKSRASPSNFNSMCVFELWSLEMSRRLLYFHCGITECAYTEKNWSVLCGLSPVIHKYKAEQSRRILDPVLQDIWTQTHTLLL